MPSPFLAALRRSLVACAVAAGLAGCSGTGLGDGPIAPIQDALRNVPIPFLNQNRDDEPAREAAPAGRLYNEGLLLINQGRHRSAALRFEELERSHPQSEFARRGILMAAYSYYVAGEYDKASVAAERYVTLHPGTEDAAYARFLQGDSNFRMIPDVARDQARAERAIQAMTEITQRYPNSEYARAAERRITIARDQLAAKEMDVGRFYLNQRAYGAALNRFKTVVQNYQNTRHIEEALFRLTEAYLALGVPNEAQAAAQILGHNFPDSQWYRDAYGLLQGSNLQPAAQSGSWVSRFFRTG